MTFSISLPDTVQKSPRVPILWCIWPWLDDIPLTKSQHRKVPVLQLWECLLGWQCRVMKTRVDLLICLCAYYTRVYNTNTRRRGCISRWQFGGWYNFKQNMPSAVSRWQWSGLACMCWTTVCSCHLGPTLELFVLIHPKPWTLSLLTCRKLLRGA